MSDDKKTNMAGNRYLEHGFKPSKKPGGGLKKKPTSPMNIQRPSNKPPKSEKKND